MAQLVAQAFHCLIFNTNQLVWSGIDTTVSLLRFRVRTPTELKPIVFIMCNTPYIHELVTDLLYHQKDYKSLVSQFA